MNSIKCEECKFGVEVNPNARVLLCENPNLKSYGKNVKHGRTFSCGYGVLWNVPEVVKVSIPVEVPRIRVGAIC